MIVIAAALVSRYLITGGWLQNHYEWNDPNTVNLLLIIVEPALVLSVLAYWVWRTRMVYRLLFISFVVQLVISAGFVAFVGFFFLTWKPKLM